MKTIHKYTIEIRDNISIKMPKNAQVLTIQMQHNEPQIWVLVDEHQDEIERRYFRLTGTGHHISEEIKSYIGTFQLYSGGLVFHLFEVER